MILSQWFVVMFGTIKYCEQFYLQLAYHFMDSGNRSSVDNFPDAP